MILQELVTNAAIELLNQPQVIGKVRQFGITTDYKPTQAELLSLIMPDGVELYEISGNRSFHMNGKEMWVTYLLSTEDVKFFREFKEKVS